MVSAVLASCAQAPTVSEPSEPATSRPYTVVYALRIESGEGDAAKASIRVEQESRRLRELRFRIDPDRHSDFDGDGEVTVADGRLTWVPPRKGGVLTYTVQLSQQRRNGAYDARKTATSAFTKTV